ncbi:MAG: CDP-diacylglycerol--glycerol-3-phosphate 3-phosphatidyltransferase [Clostridiales bacterium]|nr:CDP-diacylglycerol--glycerol-3-phosphate 3-phosphatidyltransferase [Clostridiales bacterium]
MNLPNKLTILRIFMIPLCVLFVALGWYVVAGIVFIIASVTDFLDGYIARKQNIVTNFGKFADPVADKILALVMMVALIPTLHYPWWAVCIVAARELAVDGLRLVAVEQGIVIPAGKLGKVKTNFQFFSVISALFLLPYWATLTLCILMSLLTIASGAQYFIASKKLFSF